MLLLYFLIFLIGPGFCRRVTIEITVDLAYCDMQWVKWKRKRISGGVPLLITVLVFAFRISQIPSELFAYYDLISSAATGRSCRLPQLDPYDSSIRQYISKPEPIHCKKIQPMLTFLDVEQSELVLNETAVHNEGLTVDQLDCQYRCFGHDDGVGDDSVKV